MTSFSFIKNGSAIVKQLALTTFLILPHVYNIYLVISDSQHTECSNLKCYNENNVASWLSPQWLCSNSCTWVHYVWFVATHALVATDT